MFPKNGELRGGERWDSASKAWCRADEWQRRQWAREDAVFARAANQGELTCPMIIRDSLGLHGVQSQSDGKHYDSKRAMRKHYREAGVIEVGNDGQTETRFIHGPRAPEDPHKERKQDRAIHYAFNRLGIPPV